MPYKFKKGRHLSSAFTDTHANHQWPFPRREKTETMCCQQHRWKLSKRSCFIWIADVAKGEIQSTWGQSLKSCPTIKQVQNSRCVLWELLAVPLCPAAAMESKIYPCFLVGHPIESHPFSSARTGRADPDVQIPRRQRNQHG